MVLCFDGISQHVLCRTTKCDDATSPVWNESFTVNLTDSVRAHKELGHSKPKSLTFLIREGSTATDLGHAFIPIKTIMTTGGVDGEYELHNGTGILRVKATVRKAKLNSMLGAGAASAAAAGLIGFLASRNSRRKRRERHRWGSHGGTWNGGGVGYGYHDSSSSDENEGGLLDWWDMDDASSDEDSNNLFHFNETWSSSEDERADYNSSSSSDYNETEDSSD